MLKIGMDKTDKLFRKFEYDDERKYGNIGAEMFKVLYEETGEFGEVLCKNVISIKKSNNVKNHFLDIPKHNEFKNNDIHNPELTIDVYKTLDKISEPVITTEEKKKTKSTKVKSKTTILKGEPIENKEIAIGFSQPTPKSYEYDVFVIDNISYTEDVKYKLNELGKDGWEVCGFQIVQKLFGAGSQAVIIMKKGLN